ncbi:MAG: ABC-type Fe3+-siderophore transport system, ATPase component [uncultured Solirubrobacteraceae bacterium]|uniref:ABC-type Fe3+-siderophore transport system, ATPase component n=1 Tax=uncultured Solirubrobacteraceae bacterium TaxID=1162706 RepID=A0A6J4RNS3_9ACTN|nr:MAG: ABC-type Fe3+-siderophore transport system, ATPase component [uncultured Solirubrobacteraceae bacterium]
MTLSARQLTLSYGTRPVVSGLDLEVTRGRVTALVGANASGKSTLLRALGRLLTPSSGTVLLDGAEIARLSTREVARRIAILPQDPAPPESFAVRHLVAQGRYPHQQLLGRWTAHDEQAVEAALAATGIADLADRPLDELSGGQRQHAWIALTLAQETDVLLLDEPTTYLDMAHQVDVLELLAKLNHRDGRTIVMVLHDLNQAARYADEVIALRAGRVVCAGPPAEVITEELVQEVFGLEVRILEDPLTGGPLCVPARTSRAPAGAIVAPR